MYCLKLFYKKVILAERMRCINLVVYKSKGAWSDVKFLSNLLKYKCYVLNKAYQEGNPIYLSLEVVKKSMNLKDLYGSLVAPVILLSLFCIVIISKLVPCVLELHLGANYPGRCQKLPKYRSKNKLPLQLKQQTIMIL